MAPKIKPEDLVIRWGESARATANRIRAFSPKPGAYTWLRGKRFKLFKPAVEAGNGVPGGVLDIDQGKLRIGTPDGILRADEVQIEGRKRMAVAEFCRGYSLEPGTLLGE